MKLKLTELEAETENSKIVVDFNNSALKNLQKKTINKIIKNIKNLKNIINILDLTPINNRR